MLAELRRTPPFGACAPGPEKKAKYPRILLNHAHPTGTMSRGWSFILTGPMDQNDLQWVVFVRNLKLHLRVSSLYLAKEAILPVKCPAAKSGYGCVERPLRRVRQPVNVID